MKINKAYQETARRNNMLTNDALSSKKILDEEVIKEYCDIIKQNLGLFARSYGSELGFEFFWGELYSGAASLVNRVKTKFEKQSGEWTFAPASFLHARKLK